MFNLAKKIAGVILFMKLVKFCFSVVLTHQTKNRDRTQLNLKISCEKCPL